MLAWFLRFYPMEWRNGEIPHAHFWKLWDRIPMIMAREQKTSLESLLYHAAISTGDSPDAKRIRDDIIARVNHEARGSAVIGVPPTVPVEQRRMEYRRFFGNT